MSEYISLVALTTHESQKAPEKLLNADVTEVELKERKTAVDAPSCIDSGFESCIYLLPTPRQGIELVESSSDEFLLWSDDGEEYDDTGAFDQTERFGIASDDMICREWISPGRIELCQAPHPLDTPLVRGGSETKSKAAGMFSRLPNPFSWLASQEGLSFTERRKVPSRSLTDHSFSIQNELDAYGPIAFESEPIHAAPPNTTTTPTSLAQPTSSVRARGQYGQFAPGGLQTIPGRIASPSAARLASNGSMIGRYNSGALVVKGSRSSIIKSPRNRPGRTLTHPQVPEMEKYSATSAKLGKTKKKKSDASTTKKNKKKKVFGMGIWKLLTEFWFLTILVVFVPLGIISGALKWKASVSFFFNFMAIVPMAWLIGQCTEDVASRLGQVYGGLVNAWMGNVVEMVLVVAALKHNEIVVVRATLIGSILSNILLVAGCSFLFGGMKFKVQEFNSTSAGILSSLLMLAVLCMGLPTVYNTVLDKADADLLNISRIISFFLIFVYAQYMFFQLYSHAFMFQDDDEEDEEEEYLSLPEALLILIVASVVCTICSEYLIRSIDGTVQTLNLSKEFIGIILLPIIGNAAEHYTAVVVSMKNKMDLSIGCAIGSSVQMALLVTPFSVLAGWMMGVPMTLDLHPYELMVLMASVLLVQSIISAGKTNWLEGSLLCCAYLVISIIYFVEDPKYSDLL